MKKHVSGLLLVFILITSNSFSQGVAINITGNNPDTSAMLDISSNNKGLLIPRMTTAERNAIISPAEGLQIFNLDSKCFEFFAFGIWQAGICGVCPGPNTPAAGTHIPDLDQIEWDWDTVAGATGYKWNTVNDYGSATDVGINTAYTQTGLICATPYTLYVWAYNTCNNSSVATLTETTTGSLPAQPSIITGTTPVCQGQNGIAYSVVNDPGITYDWTYSGVGFSCASNCTSNSITANFSGAATSGTLTCTPSNSCGNGPARTLSITVNGIPSNVTASASPNPVCQGDTLFLTGSATGATNWSWTGPDSYSSSIQNPSILNITTAAAGVYTLTASNICGSDDDTTLYITVDTTTIADAGPDQLNVISLTLTTTLAGNVAGTGNTGAWTIVSGAGGSFSDTTANNSSFTGVAGNSYTLRWTMTSACSSTQDEVDVSFAPPGWDYYTGAEDGALAQLNTYTFTGMSADIMNNNSILMYASTTANTTLNHKCYVITWDGNNDVTFTEQAGLEMTLRNVRSLGNYYNSLSNANFCTARLTSDPGSNGLIGFFFTQEGTGGGNQFMNYNIFSYTTGSNVPVRLSSMTDLTEVGTNQAHYGSNRTLPMLGRDRFIETGIGAGGYNYTDGVGFTYNPTTGIAARSSSVGTGNVVMNNTRENFGMTTEVSGGVGDAVGFYWGDNGFFMQNTWYGPTHTTAPSITQTTIPTSGFSRIGYINQNKWHQRIPGHLLNGSRRLGNYIYWFGIRSVISSPSTPPNVYFTNDLVVDMRFAPYNTYLKGASTHLSVDQSIGVSFLSDGGGNYAVRMQPINVTDPLTTTPTISAASLNVLTVTDLTRTGTINDVQIIGIDATRYLILICESNTNTIIGKIVQKPSTP